MKNKTNQYDVIVIGGGHAGIEAAHICAKRGLQTLLITQNKNHIGAMPCNPAIGGPAKGILVKEIDALGGIMGTIANKTALQIKLLNSSKGPAVQAIRAQIDKVEYGKLALKMLKKLPNLTIHEAMITELLIQGQVIQGVLLATEEKFLSKIVILTTGTYLSAKVYRGKKDVRNCGPLLNARTHEKSVNSITDQLKAKGINFHRLKTGTPPRILKSSIDYSKLTKEPGSDLKISFSVYRQFHLPILSQEVCWITHTSEKTNTIIQKNLHHSPFIGNEDCGKGPRYCPSIEDKIVRFNDKKQHLLFIEPESKQLNSMYLQGFSTSLPVRIQKQLIPTIIGLEHAKVLKWGYAIEYDAIDPIQLLPTLETKQIANLFTAGQINSTSGYEEAAVQGLIAGINAVQKILNQPYFILQRNQAYIGVLIDDLVTKGTSEPYRILNSHAEYRLTLRNDNVDFRLAKIAFEHQLISKHQYQKFLAKQKRIGNALNWLKTTKTQLGLKQQKHSYFSLLKRADFNFNQIPLASKMISVLTDEDKLYLKNNINFEGYLAKEARMIDHFQKIEHKFLPTRIDYEKINGLSLEAVDKLKQVNPLTIAQALRISGISHNDIFYLMHYLNI